MRGGPKIAVRAGLKAVLVGEVRPVGRKFMISARLFPATAATYCAVARAAMSPPLFPRSIAYQEVARARGESLAAARRSALEDVTTTSLDAPMLYSQAMRGGEYPLALLREAVAMTRPSLAHRRLARAFEPGPARPRWSHHAGLALHQVSARERHMIEGSYYAFVGGDHARSAAAFERMIELYPNDPVARHGRAVALEMAGDLEAAEAEYKKALGVDSMYLPGLMVMVRDVLLSRGKTDEAEAGYQRLMSLAPTDGHRLIGARIPIHAGSIRSPHSATGT
jgi:tetratricopeptide (TPR) repeat protein